MCYDDQARPPEPPGAKGKAHGQDLTLTAADGNRFAAYYARPEHPAGPQVLIYPDVRGLHHFYKELALRFAEAGIGALAFDYFGRTAGTGKRDETFEHMPHVQKLMLPTVFADVTAALDYLRQSGDGRQAPFILGFCMGGSLTLMTGTADFKVSGIIAFYSGLSRKFEGSRGSVLQQAGKIHYPLLGLFGGADQGIPESQRQELDRALEKAGVEHQLVVYPGAPHSFFDRMATEHAEASADAWKRVLEFVEKHS